MSEPNPFERLRALETLVDVPDEELRWLVGEGRLATYEAGAVIAPRGQRIESLWVVLSGRVAVRVDRGAGLRRVVEWRAGEVSGMLPYSRMAGPPGDNSAVERTETLTVPVEAFPEMVHRCPTFTAFCVHSMLDRARTFNASDLQDEKMVSLGKLAAGLAHELNNPASAAVRSAKTLQECISDADAAIRSLGVADVSPEVFATIERAGRGRATGTEATEPTPLERADREDEMVEWLLGHDLDSHLAPGLAETSLDAAELDAVASEVTGDRLEAILKWVTARATTHTLAAEIGEAVTRIDDLVCVVKRFTYMDNRSGSTLADVVSGLRDTAEVLASKAGAKGASISIRAEPGLARVEVPGDELNQVWMSLLDNALDAVGEGGRVEVTAAMELGRVVVRVVDDGPGIDPDVLPHVFDPFFTTKPPGQGTGLGLEIARRIARGSLGDISAESRPGRTEFRVSLPAGASDAAPGSGMVPPGDKG